MGSKNCKNKFAKFFCLKRIILLWCNTATTHNPFENPLVHSTLYVQRTFSQLHSHYHIILFNIRATQDVFFPDVFKIDTAVASPMRERQARALLLAISSLKQLLSALQTAGARGSEDYDDRSQPFHCLALLCTHVNPLEKDDEDDYKTLQLFSPLIRGRERAAAAFARARSLHSSCIHRGGNAAPENSRAEGGRERDPLAGQPIVSSGDVFIYAAPRRLLCRQ